MIEKGSFTPAIPLGDLCNEIYRYPSYYGIEYIPNGIPEVRAELINANGILSLDKESWRYISDETAMRFPRTSLLEGDFVMSVRGTIGKVALIPKELVGANITANLLRISPDNRKVNSKYLWRFMRSPYFQNALKKVSPNTTIKTIRVTDIKAIEIPSPSLTEQKRIATILDKADAIRRKREKAIELADNFLKSVFLDMFGDPVTNPKGWKRSKIMEMGVVVTGNTPSRKKPEYYGNDIEWIKSDNINKPFHYLTKADEGLSKEGLKVSRNVKKNSTLVTCIAGSLDCIGNAAMTDRTVAFNQQINAVTPFTTIDPYFFYVHVFVAKRLIQKASTNSMKGMVSKGKFQDIKFINPPKDLQAKFGTFFKKYYQDRNKLMLSYQSSEALFQSLSQKAFRGDL